MPKFNAPEPAQRVHRLEHQLKALRDVGLMLESTMSLDEVLTLVVEKTTQLMEAERSSLFLSLDDGGLVSRVLEGKEVNEIRLAPGQGLAGWVARHGRPLVIPDVYQDERFDSRWDKISGYRTRDVICVPLVGRNGSVIGVTEVLNKIEGTFDKSDLELLALLAGKLALTIENSRLLVDLAAKNKVLVQAKLEIGRRNRELEVLFDLERLVTRADTMETLVSSVLGRTLEITHACTAMLYRLDESGAEMRVATPELSVARVIRVPAGQGFAGWVAAKGQELCLASPEGDPRYTQNLAQRIGIPLRNLAAVPLGNEGQDKVGGALLVANKDLPGGFDENDLSLLRPIAVQLHQAMLHFSDREERERERRLATLGRLLAGVLHDLKSPITVVSGYAELLAAKADDEEAREYSGHIRRALERISTITEEIISFSRGERRVLLSTVPVARIVEKLVNQITPHLNSKKIELKQHVRTARSAQIDMDKLLRALHNVALNAIEAMGPGGRLTLEVDHLGEELVISLTDTGPGIPDEIQGSIFHTFVTQGKDHGTGLGLSVTREIVEAHGGKISFNTVRGEGTTFLVSIPAEQTD